MTRSAQHRAAVTVVMVVQLSLGVVSLSIDSHASEPPAADAEAVPIPDRCEGNPYIGPLNDGSRVKISANNELIATFASVSMVPIGSGAIVLDNGVAFAWYVQVSHPEDDSTPRLYSGMKGSAVRVELNANQRQMLANIVNARSFFALRDGIGPCVMDGGETRVYVANSQHGHRVAVRGILKDSALRGLSLTLDALLGDMDAARHASSDGNPKRRAVSTGVMIDEVHKYMTRLAPCDPRRVFAQTWLDRVFRSAGRDNGHSGDDTDASVCDLPRYRR